jgi:U1 zinc finger
MKKYFCVFCKTHLKYKSHEGWISHNAGEKHQQNRREFYLKAMHEHPEVLEGIETRRHRFYSILAGEELPRGALAELLQFKLPEEPDILGFQRYLSRLLRIPLKRKDVRPSEQCSREKQVREQERRQSRG